MHFYLSAITSQNKIALIKLIFNSVSRLNQSSLINNTVTNKIKHFPQLFALGKEIAKRKWHYFFSWSVITAKLDHYVYKYKDGYICKGLIASYLLGHNK